MPDTEVSDLRVLFHFCTRTLMLPVIGIHYCDLNVANREREAEGSEGLHKL